MDLLWFCGCGFVVGYLAGIYLVCFKLLGFLLWFIWLVATGCGGGWSLGGGHYHCLCFCILVEFCVNILF